MSNSLAPIVYETKAKRLAGVEPNFILEHTCPKCGVMFLCPDRYEYKSCTPSDFAAKYGNPMKTITCLPCAGNFDAESRAVWNEANAIKGAA